MTGDWSHSTSKRDDIKASLLTAMEQILDDTLWCVPDFQRIIVSQTVYHNIATWHARAEWKDLYRAARRLGNRQLAFDRIGNRRRLFQVPEGYEAEL